MADKRTKRSFDPKRRVGARCVAFAQAEGMIVRALAGDTLSLVVSGLALTLAAGDNATINIDKIQ